MTVTLRKSQVPEGFAAKVEAFRQAKLAHRSTVGVAAPTSDLMVERCVRRVNQGNGKPDDFVADYEVVDDTPPPAPLKVKKEKLTQEVLQQEQLLRDQYTLPAGKLRLLGMQADDIERAGGPKNDDDKAVLAQISSIGIRHKAISRWGAEQMAEVDDLNDATVDKWAMTPFKPMW